MKFTLVLLFTMMFLVACSDKTQQPNPQNHEKVETEKIMDTKWVSRAKDLTLKYKLTSTSIDCLIFDEGEVSKGKKEISVREMHNEKCGGDPQTAPRLFSFEIDMATGEYKTDRYSNITGGGYESLNKLSQHLLEE